ncbi:putative site-specific recombinase [Vibrio coralliirubri]|uniref:recombinase family protein n=1 Tax=Vibrio coralliirubri TaxID=1516159 RepID=UPI0006346062|nr:recombinase family protein [Vibrio coralliirubri]CDT80662.1 putative site-specific recombinase [Vibrio coralliirubri]
MIKAYLRASTDEQDASRATDYLTAFAKQHNVEISEFYIENESGAKLDRPELFHLIDSCNEDDILLVEQVDRLSRLESSDWKKLKRIIEDKRIKIVSVDLPTSYAALQKSESGLVNEVLNAVNTMLLDVLATMARKDYEDRRRRQAEGIERNKHKFVGKQQSDKTVAKCKQAIDLLASSDKLTKQQAAKAVGVGVATLYRYIKAVDEAVQI